MTSPETVEAVTLDVPEWTSRVSEPETELACTRLSAGRRELARHRVSRRSPRWSRTTISPDTILAPSRPRIPSVIGVPETVEPRVPPSRRRADHPRHRADLRLDDPRHRDVDVRAVFAAKVAHISMKPSQPAQRDWYPTRSSPSNRVISSGPSTECTSMRARGLVVHDDVARPPASWTYGALIASISMI